MDIDYSSSPISPWIFVVGDSSFIEDIGDIAIIHSSPLFLFSRRLLVTLMAISLYTVGSIDPSQVIAGLIYLIMMVSRPLLMLIACGLVIGA
jgi:hypothetical protein